MMYHIKHPKKSRSMQTKNGKAYGRMDIYKSLGFTKSKALTDWLRDNYFMNHENLPAKYLIKNGFMKFNTKKVYMGPRFIAHKSTPWRYERNVDCPTKNVYVPLFTNKGINFFKWLQRDPEQLQKVVAEIKASLLPGTEIKNNSNFQNTEYDF